MQALGLAAEHLGLVVQLQLAVVHGGAQRVLHGHAVLGELVDGRGEALPALAALLLGHVHGLVGMAQQGVDVGAVLRVGTDAHAGVRNIHGIANGEGLGNALQQAPGHGFGLGGAAVGQQQREFVAGQAAQHIAGAGRSADALRHFAQQGIPGRMALAVVDQLETVQVHKQQCAGTALGGVQGVGGAAVEHAAVGQLGQRVVVGQLVDTFARTLAFHGHGAQVDAGLCNALVQGVGTARLAEVQGEHADHLAVMVEDGRGPAGQQAGIDQALLQALQLRRALAQIGLGHRLGQEGGRAAGAHVGGAVHAVQALQRCARQAGAGQRVQAALLVHLQYAHCQRRGDALHVPAQAVQQLRQRTLMGCVLQRLFLQRLETLGEGDVGEHHGLA